jgi:predicted dehydrogenase
LGVDKIRVAVIGAGRWAASAHLPGFARSPLCEVLVICDLDEELARARAKEFSIPGWTKDYQSVLSRDDIDVVDVCTRGENHEEIAFAALEAGKHCLCEKPVAHNYLDTWRAHRLAQSKGLLTKVGNTFRWAPAMQYMQDMIKEGFVGTPFVFNGYEQNSQWLSPEVPIDKRILKTRVKPDVDGSDLSREGIELFSLENYGAPTIDISLMTVGSDLARVTGIMSNMVPLRRRTNLDEECERINVDDTDIYIGEYRNGAICSLQTSIATVGNYPGIEARIYGKNGAFICRLVDEHGECQRLWQATPDAVDFTRVEIPLRYFPPGYHKGEPWSSLFYANLVHSFMKEIADGGKVNEGNFADSARVQEVINAAALSHRERRWVELRGEV